MTAEDQASQRRPAQEYSDARLAWVRLQALDAASTNCVLTLGVQAATVRNSQQVSPSGEGNPVGGLRAASFKLSGPGVRNLERVRKIGDITIRQSGGGPATVDNFVLVLNAAFADDLVAWRDAGLAGGGAGTLKTLTLQYLQATQRSAEFALNFKGAGVLRVTRIPGTGDVEVELFCASVELLTTPAVSSGPDTGVVPGPDTKAGAGSGNEKLDTAAADTGKGGSPEEKAEGAQDKGLRDPGNFPRPEGLVRDRYELAAYSESTRESADYHSKLAVGVLLERYTEALQKAGWKRTSFNESGNTELKRMFLMEWVRSGMNVDLRLYGAKGGSEVSLTLTTKKSP